ncbi:hypothetical protein XAB3213_1080031 [Xanthomonas citri pv. bilvae]|nr:hypothetical protein XAB3213_1080031 [Xanthomonas citri pv. bilvae]
MPGAPARTSLPAGCTWVCLTLPAQAPIIGGRVRMPVPQQADAGAHSMHYRRGPLNAPHHAFHPSHGAAAGRAGDVRPVFDRHHLPGVLAA